MQEYSIRASSWPEFFDCPARWHARYVEKRSAFSSPEALLGTAVHAATAEFDRAAGALHPEDVIGVAVDAIAEGTSDVAWSAGGTTPRHVERDATDITLRYCHTAADRPRWEEVEFRLPDVRLEFPDLDVAITLTGTGDRRRRRDDGTLVVADLKTGRGFRAGAYVPQVGAYAVGTMVERDQATVGQLLHATRDGVQAFDVPDAAQAMLGVAGGAPGLIETAARMLGSGIVYGNPKSILCSGKFCPVYSRCSYRGGLSQ